MAGTGLIYSRGASGPAISEYQSTNVLIKRDGRWVAVASHTSGDKPHVSR